MCGNIICFFLFFRLCWLKKLYNERLVLDLLEVIACCFNKNIKKDCKSKNRLYLEIWDWDFDDVACDLDFNGINTRGIPGMNVMEEILDYFENTHPLQFDFVVGEEFETSFKRRFLETPKQFRAMSVCRQLHFTRFLFKQENIYKLVSWGFLVYNVFSDNVIRELSNNAALNHGVLYKFCLKSEFDILETMFDASIRQKSILYRALALSDGTVKEAVFDELEDLAEDELEMFGEDSEEQTAEDYDFGLLENVLYPVNENLDNLAFFFFSQMESLNWIHYDGGYNLVGFEPVKKNGVMLERIWNVVYANELMRDEVFSNLNFLLLKDLLNHDNFYEWDHDFEDIDDWETGYDLVWEITYFFTWPTIYQYLKNTVGVSFFFYLNYYIFCSYFSVGDVLYNII